MEIIDAVAPATSSTELPVRPAPASVADALAAIGRARSEEPPTAGREGLPASSKKKATRKKAAKRKVAPAATARTRARAPRTLQKWVSAALETSLVEPGVSSCDQRALRRGLIATVTLGRIDEARVLAVFGQRGPERRAFIDRMIRGLEGQGHVVVGLDFTGRERAQWGRILESQLRNAGRRVALDWARAEAPELAAIRARRESARAHFEQAQSDRARCVARLSASASAVDPVGAHEHRKVTGSVVHAFGDRQSAVDASKTIKEAWSLLGMPVRKLEALALATGEESIGHARDMLAEVEAKTNGVAWVVRVLSSAQLMRSRGFWVWGALMASVASATPWALAVWPAATTPLLIGALWALVGLGGGSALIWAARRLSRAQCVFARIDQLNQQIARELTDARDEDLADRIATREAQVTSQDEARAALDSAIEAERRAAVELRAAQKAWLEVTASATGELARADSGSELEEATGDLRRRCAQLSEQIEASARKGKLVLHLESIDDAPARSQAEALDWLRQTIADTNWQVLLDAQRAPVVDGSDEPCLYERVDLGVWLGRRELSAVQRTMAQRLGMAPDVLDPAHLIDMAAFAANGSDAELDACVPDAKRAETSSRDQSIASGEALACRLPITNFVREGELSADSWSSGERRHMLQLAEFVTMDEDSAEALVSAYAFFRRCQDADGLQRLLGREGESGLYPHAQLLLALAIARPSVAATIAALANAAVTVDAPAARLHELSAALESAAGLPTADLRELRRYCDQQVSEVAGSIECGGDLGFERLCEAARALSRVWFHRIDPRQHADWLAAS